jgi:hypothetical protein
MVFISSGTQLSIPLKRCQLHLGFTAFPLRQFRCLSPPDHKIFANDPALLNSLYSPPRWVSKSLSIWLSLPSKLSAMKVHCPSADICSQSLTIDRNGGEHESRCLCRSRTLGRRTKSPVCRIQERHRRPTCVVEDCHIDRTERGVKRQRSSSRSHQGVSSTD